MKLPLKFRILQVIASEPGVSNCEMATRIAAEYPGERQARRSVVADHLTAFETMGMINSRPLALAEDGSLVEGLTLTAYGLDRLRFLPRRARA